MSQFRQNPITKQWVLIAPNRAKKPEDFRTYSVMHGLPDIDSACVFCPGNEHLNQALEVSPPKGDWELRVIKNKFHALDQTKIYNHRDFYNSRSGYGDHEVIITRKHNEPIALQSINTVSLTLQTIINRMEVLKEDPSISYVQAFHNHGRDAGASIIHPHHQILATPLLPPHVHNEMLGCYHYYNIHKTCVYCDIMDEERKHQDRVVYENDNFMVISPYSSRSPFETWILPKKHGARFEDISPEEVQHLSFVLKMVLGKLYTKLSDPPLNFYIHTMPVSREAHTMQEEGSYHWHLTVFPRLTIWAGFEFATGIPVNPMPPEETASFLKN
jgi:UDPglucose--hexose-1-phosphate uridylyltransferase